MTMCHQHVFDVGQLDADLPQVSNEMIDMGFMKRVDQNDAIARSNNPGGNPAYADVIDVIKSLPRLDILSLGIAEPSTKIRRHFAGPAKLLESGKDVSGGTPV